MTPGGRLRAAREAAGFRSASSAAASLGLSASTYTAHENGQNALAVEHAHVYAKAFGVAPSWLLFGEEARTAPAVIALIRVLERKGMLTSDESREVFELAAMISDGAR